MTHFLDAFAAFFAASVFFWSFVVLSVILFFTFVEKEYGGYATILLVISFLLLNYLYHVPIVEWTVRRPWYYTVGYVAAYFALGALWCGFKWYFYSQKHLDLYNEIKREFIASEKLKIKVNDPIPEGSRAEWKNYFASHNGYGFGRRVEAHPQISKHKRAAYIWIAYFPFSFVWTIVNDPLKRVVRWTYNRISATLQRISDHIWRGAAEDFVDPNA